MAELTFYCGTMNSGKSTLALQTAHNHKSRGRSGTIFTNSDRGGPGVVSSRLGLRSEAIEVHPLMDLHRFVADQLSNGTRIDFIICDEAQFFEAKQIEELTQIVDGLGIDVYAFGILTDFRTHLFPGSTRLVELADRVLPLQVEALCWCGERGTHNARIRNGAMTTEGDQIAVGEVSDSLDENDEITYEVLCRRHHLRKVISRNSNAALPQSLPFTTNN